MLTASAIAILAVAAIWRIARREHAAALSHRAGLLREAASVFPAGRQEVAPDGFPRFSAPLPGGGEVVLGLVADTLVTRRLPQLWLLVTLREPGPVRDFSVGALARPTGAEFYALTHDLPDWLVPPEGDTALLVRGRNVPPRRAAAAAPTLSRLFADPWLKEVAATPRALRVVRHACQGERGAHLLLRQARFGLDAVPAEVIRRALEDAALFAGALDGATSPAAEAA